LPAKVFSIWYLAIPVLALPVFFLLNSKKEKTVENSTATEIEVPIKKDERPVNQTEFENEPILQSQEVPIKDKSIPIAQNKQEKKDIEPLKAQATPPQLAIADFTENNVLEQLISNEPKGNEDEIASIAKTVDQKISAHEACKVRLLLGI